MSTIVATLTAGTPLPTVQVDITITTPATALSWTVTRDAGPYGKAVMRQGTQSALSMIDAEAPIEVPFTYRLDVTRNTGPVETVTTAPLTITGTAGCYLSDPFSDLAMSIEVQQWPNRTYVARQSPLAVLARTDPVVLSDVHTLASGTWVLITRTDADTALMKTILMGSGFAQLRTQPGSSIPSVYVAVGTVDEARYSGKGGDQRRLTSVDIQEIGALPSAARDVATLQGLSTQGATLADLNALRPTLLQLSQLPVG